MSDRIYQVKGVRQYRCGQILDFLASIACLSHQVELGSTGGQQTELHGTADEVADSTDGADAIDGSSRKKKI